MAHRLLKRLEAVHELLNPPPPMRYIWIDSDDPEDMARVPQPGEFFARWLTLEEHLAAEAKAKQAVD